MGLAALSPPYGLPFSLSPFLPFSLPLIRGKNLQLFALCTQNHKIQNFIYLHNISSYGCVHGLTALTSLPFSRK